MTKHRTLRKQTLYTITALVACGFAACGDLENTEEPQGSSGGSWPFDHTQPAPEDEPEGAQFFEHLRPIPEDEEDPPYCDPTSFVPPASAGEVVEGCDGDTDPLVPCRVDVYTFDEPVVCEPVVRGESDECNQRTSSFAPEDSTWLCDLDTLGYHYGADYEHILEDVKSDVARNTMIPPEVLAQPSAAYVDVTNDRGLRVARYPVESSHPEENTAIYYTYDDQDRLSAWAIVHGQWRFMLGQMDTNGTLRVWTRTGLYGPEMCSAHFNSRGRLLNVSCDGGVSSSTTSASYHESFDCRGFLTSRGSRYGESHPSSAKWVYDDFGRIVQHTQEDSLVYEEYTATYAQNPAQPVTQPSCGAQSK